MMKLDHIFNQIYWQVAVKSCKQAIVAELDIIKVCFNIVRSAQKGDRV